MANLTDLAVALANDYRTSHRHRMAGAAPSRRGYSCHHRVRCHDRDCYRRGDADRPAHRDRRGPGCSAVAFGQGWVKCINTISAWIDENGGADRADIQNYLNQLADKGK